MANSCITKNEQQRIAKGAVDGMSEGQKNNYGITSENRQTVESVLHCIVSTELKENPKKEELENSTEKFLDFFDNDFSKIEVSPDSVESYNDMYDLFLAIFDSRFAEIDISNMSEQEMEEDDRVQLLQLCGDLAYVYKDPEKKFIRAFLKEPVEGTSPQDITIKKIMEIASLDFAQEYVFSDGRTILIPKGKKAPFGSHKTGRYSYGGEMINTITVSEDIYGNKEGNFPVLSSPIGNAVDKIGRLYFNKKSSLYNPDGSFNESKIETLVSEDLNMLFTKKGLLNLLEDFKELERQIRDMWPGCVLISDEITMFGKISEDKWITGKPDLIAVDREGIAHVLDFKTRIIQKANEGLFAYQNALDGVGEGYGKQMSRYIRMLQAYTVNTSETPYAILVDTWYDSSDLGDINLKDNQHIYDYKAEKDKPKGYYIAKSNQPLAEYVENFKDKDGIERTPGLQDVLEDEESTIYYIEPRLHTATEEVDGRIQYSSDLAALRGPKDNVPFDEKAPTYLQQFLDASEEEQRIYEQQDGKPKERKLAQGITRLGPTDIESRESPFSSIELMDVAEFTMYAVSDLINFIQGGAEFEELPTTEKQMLKGKSHAEIIKSVGIDNLIDYVFDSKIAGNYDKDLPMWDKEKYPTWKEFSDNNSYVQDWYGDDEEEYQKAASLSNKAKWLIEHRDQFLSMGFTKLMALEKTIKPQKREEDGKEKEAPNSPDPVNDNEIKPDSGDNEANDEFAERYIEGLTDLEAWMLGQRNYSVKASLAQEIRRMLENIILRNENGNIMEDSYGWGFPMHLDSTEAMQMLLDALKNCETFEEMQTVLKSMAVVPQTSWTKDVLDKLDADKNLKAKFYSHFRKDALTYSISSVKTDPETGRRIIETRVINTRPAYATIKDSLAASFMSGTVGMFNGKPMISNFEFQKDGIKDVHSRIENKISATREKIRALYNSKGQRKGNELSEYIMTEMMKEEDGKPSLIKDITDILQGIGILVTEDVVERCCSENIARSISKSNAGNLLGYAQKAISRLIDQDKDGELPQGLKGNYAYPQYMRLLELLSSSVESVVEASVYEGGKTYYSYTNPSRIGHIIRNLKDSINSLDPENTSDDSKFKDYIQDNFGRYEGWFKSVPDEEGKSVWLNDWLEQLESSSAARTALAHKVELSYIGNHYRDLGSLGFQLSILHNYFGTKDDADLTDGPTGNKIANRWFALPTMSNKPTNEFIRMTIYGNGKGENYKDDIVEKVLMNTFLQERNRIADVLYHYIKHTTATDQMDILDPIKKKDKLFELIKRDTIDSNPEMKEEEAEKIAAEEVGSFKQRIRNSEITLEDLIRLNRITSGAKFHFLWYLNDAIRKEENREFADSLVGSINMLLTPNDDAGKEKRSQIKESYSEDDLLNQTESIIRDSMNGIVRAELDNMHKIGLFDKVQRKYIKNGKEYIEETLKYWEEFTVGGKKGNWLGKEATVEAMERELTEFIWQDIAANINIIQITGGDLAYYGNAVNYQKRIAQIHSPGLHLIHDEDYDDGYLRSVHISDETAVSEILLNAETALNEYMETISNPEARKEYKRMISGILKDFKDIDVTDGQSYSCPTSKRKKLALRGEWSDEREEAYKKIIKGDFRISNLNVLLQPDKPFATSDMAKYSDSPTMTLRKTPLQDKNSEYLILLAEALSRGAGKQSKMSAIFDFMEATVQKDKDGNPINKNGIDTVHFASVGKVGVSGVIDLNAFDKQYKGDDKDYHKTLTKYMLEHVIPANSNAKGLKSVESAEDRKRINSLVNEKKLKVEESYYNPMYVDTIPLDDYIIQQEVPAHLYDPNGQLYGSQIRILGISDITPGTEFRVWNAATRKYEIMSDHSKEGKIGLIEEYKQLHADNIVDSFNSLMEELGLRITMEEDGKKVTVDLPEMDKMTIEQRDSVYKKLAYILRKEIVKDAKYGLDTMRACSLRYDENNLHVVDFNVPLMDPIQSKRIQMLINSIIKKVINKQKINGGPVVQVTAYDRDLHVRFQDNEGNPLPTLKEYGGDAEAYKQFLRENQAGIKHFECYMSVPNEALEKLITKEDGSLMTIEEIQKNMPDVWEAMSKVIGYRIPTEDKYSMLPLKIVGFVPRAAGQVIIMPKEITLLTGSDFDIDKMYIMMKAFNIKKIDTREKAVRQLREAFLSDMTARHIAVNTNGEPFFDVDTERIVQNASRLVKGDDVALSDGIRSSNGNIPEVYQRFIDWYRNRLVSSLFSEYSDLNASDFVAKKGARDNRLLDLQWTVLTSKDTASKMLNPGNFNPQKKIGRVIRIIKSGIRSAEDYDDLMDMSVGQLDSLLESSEQHSVTLPSSKIYFQRQNMQGTQMVGIFANNNVSHAFCSMQKIGIDLTKGGKNLEFCIDGRRVGNASTPDSIIVLDAQKGFDGQLISKTIASFLAASVDTAKDPVLNDLNVNTFTGGVAMALARMGFDTNAIGLFLSQPVIVMLSDHYFKNKTDGYYGGDTAIKEVADMIGIDSEDLDSPVDMGIADKRVLSRENLISHLADSNFYNPESDNNTSEASEEMLYQRQVLTAFKVLFKIAKDLQELTFCTKFNSVSNAVGPTIADTLEDKDRVEKFTNREEETMFYNPKKKDGERADAYGFTDASEVIENDTILSAFYNNTVGDGGASERIFRNFFPHYWSGFQEVVEDFKNNFTRKGKISSKLYNQLLDEYLYFLMTYNGIDGDDATFAPTIPYAQEDRDALIKDLIKEFEEVSDIPDRKPNMILDKKLGRGCLSIRKADEYLAVDVLTFNGAQMNSESQDKVKRAWSDLIQSKDPSLTKAQNEKLRRFGTDLFFYTLMRNGFGFSPKTLMHLASVIVRYNATYSNGFKNYIDGLVNLKETDVFLNEKMYRDRFLNQFVRNHANNRNIVPNVQTTEIKMDRGTKESTGEALIEFHSEKTYELHSIMRTSEHPCRFITVTSRDGKTHKLTRELFELDTSNGETFTYGNETRVRYKKATSLGVVNNFIEYNANGDIDNSYFSDIRKNSIDGLDEEEISKSDGRDEQQAGDDPFSDADTKKSFLSALREFEDDGNKRVKILNFVRNSKDSEITAAVRAFMDSNVSKEEKQASFDIINNKQMKCKQG